MEGLLSKGIFMINFYSLLSILWFIYHSVIKKLVILLYLSATVVLMTINCQYFLKKFKICLQQAINRLKFEVCS